ncbi:MAG: 3-dehydroquinate synthase [bacterium]
MRQIVDVSLGERSYPIFIGEGILTDAINDLENGLELAVVTDSNVSTLPWFFSIETLLKAKASKYLRCVVPAGEESKSVSVFVNLCSQLTQHKFSRRAVVVAVGGGVVGDLAGFTAACYLRGVRLIQIPTTLLAMVDSSVGGKTAINLPEGKNLVGAFYQPEKVIMDVDTLKTLPQRERAAGMAEVMKYGLIRDKTLWKSIASGNAESLSDIIARCVQIKADIVSEDERDVSGERALLNFGHTIGHAIEQTSGYGEWLHGEAIAVGMVAAAMISERVFGLSADVTREIRRTLKAQGLPVRLPKISNERLLEAIARDKKSTGQKIQWVLLRAIGRAESSDAVTESLLIETLNACRDA